MEHFENPNLYAVLYNRMYGGFNDVRHDQDIIRFMIKEGLTNFQHNVCKLGITFLPIYENIRIGYKINEYDGLESICLNIPYREIVKDFANNTNDNGLTQYIRERGFDTVNNAINGRLHRYCP